MAVQDIKFEDIFDKFMSNSGYKNPLKYHVKVKDALRNIRIAQRTDNFSKFVHLGFLFDTETMSLTCPADKVERIKNMCYEILVSGSSTVLGLEKLFGTLESVRPAVPLAALPSMIQCSAPSN